MRQGTIVTVPPSGHPLSLAEAKRQLRIEEADTDQDAHITALIAAAHRMIERELGYPILRQTRQTHLMQFPCGPIWLAGGHDLEVLSIQYRDSAGAVQLLDPAKYALDAISRPAQVLPASGQVWPATSFGPGAVMVEWRAGWPNAAEVPEDLVHAMKLLVAHWDQNREAVVVATVATEVQLALAALLAPFRVPFVA